MRTKHAREEQGSTGPVTQPVPEPTEAPTDHPETPTAELPAELQEKRECDESEVQPTGRPRLPDVAFVVRGGQGTADRFIGGAECRDADGRLMFISVNSFPGVPWEELALKKYGIKNPKFTYTTVGEVRAAGGDVVPDPLPDNPYHALMFGLTPWDAERIFLLENGLQTRAG